MEPEPQLSWVRAHWVGIVALCVVIHAAISIVRGHQQSPHHHFSVWLIISIVLSLAGGWWVALKPDRLQAHSRGQRIAFWVAVVVFFSFDLAVKHSGGVLLRNGTTSLAWITGVGLELGRQAVVRRRGNGLVEPAPAS